jgi:translocation and assembly module TamB
MRWLSGALLAVAVLFLAALAGIGWLVGTEAGLHWAAARVPGLQTEGLRGRLAEEVSAERLRFESAGLRVEAEEISLRAHLAALLGGRITIDPFRAEKIELEVRSADEERREPFRLPLALHIANASVGTLVVQGHVVRELHLDHARVGKEVSLAGSLQYPHAQFPARAKVDVRGTLERIEARVAGEVAGIAAEARGVLVPRSAERLQEIEARAGPIDLARFGAPRTALTAELKGSLSAGGALAGTLWASNAASGPIDAERLPFTRLEARFVTDFGSARLDSVRATLAGGGTVEGEATLERRAVHAKLAAAAINLRALHSRLRESALHGPLQLSFTPERQWARASLTQAGLGFTAEAVRTGALIDVQELRAIADAGEVSATGQVTLKGAKPFSAHVEVKGFDPAALGDYPAGSLSGSLVARGTLEPREVDLDWDFAEATLYGHTFQSAGSARLAGERVAQAHGDLRLGENRLSARGAYGRAGDSVAFELDAPRLEQFTPLAGAARVRGTLSGTLANPRAALVGEALALSLPGGVELQNVAIKLDGTRDAHVAEVRAEARDYAVDVAARVRGAYRARAWVGELVSLRNAGAFPLELSAPAPLRASAGRIELGRFDARLGEGRLLVREAAWTPQRFASSGEFSRLPAQWLVVAAGLGERVNATLLLDGEWQLAHAPQLGGFVRARRADGDVTLAGAQSLTLGVESAALEVRFENARAIARAEARTPLARLALQGEVMPALALDGKIEFADLGTLTRPYLEAARLDGRLSAELHASGTLREPRFHGTLAGEALAFELPLYGVQLKDGSLKAIVEGDRVTLESLTARGGEGRFSASGVLPLALEGTARIAWRAEKLALLERPDMRLVASGAGEANYDGKRVTLTGDLRADHGRFEFARDRLPSLGDDVVVLGRPARARKERLKVPVALDLRLDLGDNLVVQAYGYDGRVAGLIDLATTNDGELRAFGRLHAVRATFLAYGQRLDVDPGVLIFDGPLDNPTLQITAWRRNQAVEAGVQITGTARAPSVNLVSQPPVPEGERLSWLVLGRPPSNATQADLGLLQAAAGALLAGGESVPLDRRIARRFGLDELTLRGGAELTDRVVAVGKRLSNRLYLSYEQGIGAVATNLIKLDYALGRRWTLRAETGSSSGGGLFYRYSWD